MLAHPRWHAARRQTPYHYLLLSFVAGLLIAVIPEADGARRYRLEVPGEDGVQSTAWLEGERLTIKTNGRVFVYDARPRLDSADGNYRAFYNAESRQYVRWPVRGSGSMYIGETSGTSVTWQKSLMQVVPLADRDRNDQRPVSPDLRRPHSVHLPDISTGRVETDGRLPTGNHRHSIGPAVVDRGETGSPNLAVMSDERGAFTAALIDKQGKLQFYEGQRRRWRHRAAMRYARLVPQAPTVLAGARDAAFPTVYTVSQHGQLIAAADRRITELSSGRSDPNFVPGTHLAKLGRGPDASLFAVDELGRGWQYDVGRRRYVAVEPRTGFFEPGSPIAAVRAPEKRVYLADIRGNLIEYHLRVDGWSRPALVADGFPPSCPVAVGFLSLDAAPGVYLVAVDARGRLRTLRETRTGWREEVVDSARLAPLSPVALAAISGRLSVCGVDAAGRWMHWRRDGGHWHQRTIADGFSTGTPVALFSKPAVALAAEHAHRLIPAHLSDGRWQCSICTPAVDRAPQLKSRRVIANPPLAPVTVNFVNSHSEPLIAQVYNKNEGGPPSEVRIPAGESVPVRIQRDAGATLEEVYIEYDRLGRPLERVRRLPIPPRSLYTIVVNVERVVSVYFDRTRNQTSVPDKVRKSQVSLGTFTLPPGDALNQGEQIDLGRHVKARRNPGARSLIEATSRP